MGNSMSVWAGPGHRRASRFSWGMKLTDTLTMSYSMRYSILDRVLGRVAVSQNLHHAILTNCYVHANWTALTIGSSTSARARSWHMLAWRYTWLMTMVQKLAIPYSVRYSILNWGQWERCDHPKKYLMRCHPRRSGPMARARHVTLRICFFFNEPIAIQTKQGTSTHLSSVLILCMYTYTV